jgi:hypothetical protein
MLVVVVALSSLGVDKWFKFSHLFSFESECGNRLYVCISGAIEVVSVYIPAIDPFGLFFRIK